MVERSRIYYLFLEAELEKHSDRLVVGTEKWRTERKFEDCSVECLVGLLTEMGTTGGWKGFTGRRLRRGLESISVSDVLSWRAYQLPDY